MPKQLSKYLEALKPYSDVIIFMVTLLVANYAWKWTMVGDDNGDSVTWFGLDITEDHYRTYIVFATGTFLNQVITGKLPATQESYEFMADLIFGGLMTTLPGVTLDKMAQIGNR